MALAYKIKKADYEKLSDELKGEYTLAGDEATLDVSGLDLKGGEKFTAERDKRRAAEKRANDAEARVTELEDQYSDGRTAVAKAEKKVTDAEAKAKASDERYASFVKKNLADTAARDLAGKLSKTAPALLVPHVRAAMDVDLTDVENPKLVFLGADGKPDANLTLEKVEKNFRDNKDYAAIITASHASGGGASRPGTVPANGNPGAGVPNPQGGSQPVDLSAMRGSDLAARISASRLAAGQEVPTQTQG